MTKDAVVVGGGFGGLSAAALLAHKGYSVTLLEKNRELGGRARVWEVDGFKFDMGPSWYLMPEVFERFFERVGKKRSDYYQLQKLSPFYRVFFGKGDYVDIDDDLEKTFATFESFEPGGADKLKKYLAEAQYKYDTAMDFFLYKEYKNIFDFFNVKIMTEGLKLRVFQKLDRFVSKYFSSRKAKQILQYAMVFLGTSPKDAPALYSLMSHVDMNLGVWFPVGGIGAMVDGFEKLCTDLGVTIVRESPVSEIITEKKRAVGVRVGELEYRADLVVSGADYQHTETTLLNEKSQTYKNKYWEKRTMAPTLFVVYTALKEKLPNVVHHNLYFDPQWDQHFSTIFESKEWPDSPSYYVSVASHDEPSVAPEGKENVFFLVPVAAGLHDGDQEREHLANKVIAHFSNLIGTDIAPLIETKRIYSQRDLKADYNAFQGTSLGLAHTLFQTAVFRPKMSSPKVKNLHYTGQYIHPGIGVPMTVIASEVLAQKVG